MKDAFKKVSAKPIPDIATKAEMLQRIRNRPKLEYTRHLTPTGTTTQSTNNRVAQENEQHLQYVRGRLKLAREKLLKNYVRSQQAGRAKSDFGRAR